jgi:4-carboxymuconolactone decarboxylase
MTRTPYLTPEQMNPEQRRIYDDIIISRGKWLNGPYAPMLHQPRMAEPAQKLGEFLRYNTSLTPRLSELAIIIVARYWDCDLPAAVIEAIRLRQPPPVRDDEQVIYEFTRDLLQRHRVEDALYERAKSYLGMIGVVELTGLIGYYTLIALTLNAHEVPLPAGVQPPLSGT